MLDTILDTGSTWEVLQIILASTGQTIVRIHPTVGRIHQLFHFHQVNCRRVTTAAIAAAVMVIRRAATLQRQIFRAASIVHVGAAHATTVIIVVVTGRRIAVMMVMLTAAVAASALSTATNTGVSITMTTVG